MRKFYQLYTSTEKSQSLIRISENPYSALSWTHYLVLIRIENIGERSFYEIEALNNNWSVRELKRQFNSSLYERLALSRDKEGIKKLAEKGQIIEKPTDILKDNNSIFASRYQTILPEKQQLIRLLKEFVV